MSNDMTRRTEFFRVLSTAIGEEASTMVLDHLPPPGWTDHIERRFDAVDQQFEVVNQRFDAIDYRFTLVDQRLDGIDRRIDGVERHMDAVETKIDRLSEQLATHMQATVQQFSDISAHMRQESVSTRMALMTFSLTVALSLAGMVVALVT